MKINSVGSKEKAKHCIEQAIKEIPAYKKFLAECGKTGQEAFELLPCTDKKNYITKYPLQELMPLPLKNSAAIFASSGSSSSGKEPFYWPYTREQLDVTAITEQVLTKLFSTDKKSTLIIDALPLGSWIGGDTLSCAFKMLSIKKGMEYTSIITGTSLDEIVMLLRRFNDQYEQILMIMDSTAFAHLILMADSAKLELPFEKMRYAFFEEGFPEDFRIALQKRAKVEETEPVAFSIYVSSDTGPLGMESPASVALRKLCFQNQKFAEHMGIKPDFPHFFHVASDGYIECVNDELWITKWQGLPLLRYNLCDQTYLYSWVETQKEVKKFNFTLPNEQKLAALVTQAPSQLPNLLIMFGRSDSMINFGGNKIYEYMFDDTIRSEELSKYLTGVYEVKLSYHDGHPYLDFLVELKENVRSDPGTVHQIENLIEKKLAEVCPDFAYDIEEFYEHRVKALGLKFVKAVTVPWPTLSNKIETEIKLRGIKRDPKEKKDQ